MPRKAVRQRRRARGFLSYAIIALSMIAATLAAILFYLDSQDDVERKKQGSGEYVDAGDLPLDERPLEMRLATDESPDASAPPEATAVTAAMVTPTPEPTAAPTYDPDDPYAMIRPQRQAEDMLPIFKKANIEQKRIAITVNECSSAELTLEFGEEAWKYGAKLTLFPAGQYLRDKTGMGDVIRKCAKAGYEIENGCYTPTSRLYRMSDHDMAMEIWLQNIYLSYHLGEMYQPHFLRVYGGNGENDRRTHAYLMQLGYIGIAHWTVLGESYEPDRIADTLAPGNIYCFKTTQEDLQKMRYVMIEARNQGYQMVTLNELFGYQANELTPSDTPILQQTMPELENYDGAYYFLQMGDHAWAVGLMQQRLMDLGYMASGKVDCVYGAGTATALMAFQARAGLAATGAADIATQQALFSEDAQPLN